ncbi:MAG TPA: hypothetical protein DCM05_07900 [Elusimicrobia bacterium]|nr:hypothetical protein [Elusimicrobiota bacterium]
MADPYKDYLDDFNRQVDSAMREQAALPKGDPLQSLRRALSEFESWWRGENPEEKKDVFAAAPQSALVPDGLRHDLQAAREEIRELKASLPAPAPSVDERASLAELERLRQEREDQRRYIAKLQEEMGAAENQFARAQDGYEATIRRLEEQGRGVSERVAGLQQDKTFLESQVSRFAERIRELEGDLEVSRANGASLEREALELKGRMAELQRTTAKLETLNAALEGALSELRVQTAAGQERLLRSRENLENELGEGRRGLERAVRAADDIRKALAEQRGQAEAMTADMRKALDEQRQELQSRLGGQSQDVQKQLVDQRLELDRQLRSTTQFLETKLREIEREAAAHYDEVRALLDNLCGVLRKKEEGTQ